MPLYQYKGVDTSGSGKNGTLEADSSKTARSRLKQQGIFVTEIFEKSSKAQEAKQAASFRIGRRVKLSSLTMMTRQLATLIKARIPLDEALSALIDQTEDTRLKPILSQLKIKVNEGQSLAKSCGAFPEVFSPVFISMITVGEASGNLDLVLNRLANFAEAQFALRNKVFGALAYPAFLMVAGSAITMFLFAFAIPKITELFAGSSMALPTLTIIMISISDFFAKYWLFISIGIVGTFFFIKWYTSTKAGRAKWDAVSLRMPVYGHLNRMIIISRFARTLSTLIGSGVQLLDAIDIVKDVVGNAVIRKALIKARESISEGHTIAGPLKASGEFPPILIHMIAVGEKTGEIEQMLNVVSDAYDTQVDTAINSMTRLLEPIMIILMGGMIALVALSIFLPMLQLNDLSSLPT